jgi:methylglyoxal synthase
MGAKPANTTRLYGQNVNGIRIDSLGGDLTQICAIIREAQIDIAGFTEHNLDSTKHQVAHVCHTSVKASFQESHSKLVMASSQFQLEGNYKPGGTMLLSTGDILSRLLESGKDPMGRWT